MPQIYQEILKDGKRVERISINKFDHYNLITDEEILTFAEKFNSNVRVKVQDLENFDKKRGYYPVVEKK